MTTKQMEIARRIAAYLAARWNDAADEAADEGREFSPL